MKSREQIEEEPTNNKEETSKEAAERQGGEGKEKQTHKLR